MKTKSSNLLRSLCVALLALSITSLYGQITPLEVSAVSFSISPKVGTPSGHSRTGHKIEEVHGDLINTLVLFKQGDEKYCIISSPLGIEKGTLNDVAVAELSKILNIPATNITANSSHNHTIPYLEVRDVERPEEGTPYLLSWELGREFLTEFKKAAHELEKNLQPVSVEWGVAEEKRITYNRKGVHLDGTTYFMREQDRLTLKGEGYTGVIDSDAGVVVFRNAAGKPVAALSFFTGHPVGAYSPEKLISYGQFPQVGSQILSKYLGDIPVAFLQGCGGNINSKHMLIGTFEQAEELGEQLGESFIIAAKSLQPSKRVDIEWSREKVKIPLDELPSLESLEQDLATIDDFIKRGNEGDENTLYCVGLNFPKALTPAYRAKLIDLIRPWYVWAINQHKTYNWRNIPTHLPFDILVARFGDVGFVGMPYETFVETGLKIKKHSALPFVLTCGYTDGIYGYIPDASGVKDMEYMSSNYRYRGKYGVFPEWKNKKDSVPEAIYSAYEFTPPYKAPAGDACADVAIKKLAEFAK
ncbi:hypothetical protein [Membranihabitans marinus]|uniref:hypothetical protein n=1 Tax=Membranihabitans marinus TaxID=1227546 RepID=UPI001F2C227F|nr:hypothetical protein [Membranihabitans marinus]